jgi:hypothetical protein
MHLTEQLDPPTSANRCAEVWNKTPTVLGSLTYITDFKYDNIDFSQKKMKMKGIVAAYESAMENMLIRMDDTTLGYVDTPENRTKYNVLFNKRNYSFERLGKKGTTIIFADLVDDFYRGVIGKSILPTVTFLESIDLEFQRKREEAEETERIRLEAFNKLAETTDPTLKQRTALYTYQLKQISDKLAFAEKEFQQTPTDDNRRRIEELKGMCDVIQPHLDGICKEIQDNVKAQAPN